MTENKIDYDYMEIYSHSNQRQGAEYFVNFFQTIQQDTEFGKKNKGIIEIAKTPFIPKLIKREIIYQGFKRLLMPKGYDAYFIYKNQEILGHNAFQIHQNEKALKVFSVGVLPDYRRQGLATVLQEGTIRYARVLGLERIRIGAGGDKKMIGLCRNLEQRSEELGIEPQENFWFKIIN